MKFRNKLLTKLIGSISLLVILPIISLGCISVYKSKSSLEQTLKLASKQTLKEVNKGFSNRVETISRQVNVLTKDDDIPDLTDSEVEHKTTVGYVQQSMKVTKETNEGILNAYYAGEYGEIILDSKVMNIKDFNFKERDWYKLAKEANGKVIFTKPFKDNVTGKQIMTIAQAVMDSDNKFVGVVAIDLSLESMESYFKSTKLLNTGLIFLVDGDGNVILSNSNDKKGVKNFSELPVWNNVKSEAEGSYEWKDKQGKLDYISQETNQATSWKLIGMINGDEVRSNIRELNLAIVITMAIAIVAGVILGAIIALRIMKELNKVNRVIGKVANGDFTERVKVTVKDEFGILGNNVNSMVENVSELIQSVETTSQSLVEASINISSMSEETTASVSEVSHAIQEVANGATSQAQSSTSVSESVEALSNGMDEIAKETEGISNLSDKTEHLSSRGLRTISALREKSKKTKENSIETTSIVTDMVKSIEKINYISNAISEITEQTNLLSLNASIEAARAGESGRGFAVVAEEIRGLSEESRNSTNQIQSIVEEINSKANAAREAMIESTKLLEVQDTEMESTKALFNEIADSVVQLTEAIKKIKTLNEKINENKSEVAEQVESIASVSEETASVSEQVSASVQEVNATMDELTEYANNLESVANKLKIEISKFKFD
ncbi:methyl-accepting chemotaxis protein [Inconstantimicrobium mannanitabidum]|uniref:Methyl-accepting chemotaxis protein n=1 Tax=Inconstantimicrobium mannanitabidum TaxID=1604901 RepID=A0ACB5R7Q1_9CLOT|nr:methyl-accepting chemotaxis protein [Clostridium sp. TW13]GKX65044.1 methyl-accepting chemotaxis protein [Clostridium sp. TW13]